MNRLIAICLLFAVYSYASLTGSNFSQRDLQILEDLDIKSSFITDYELQEVYEQFQSRRNSENYIEKLNEASLFVPRVKDILVQKGIPDVFIYMAMAESNFDIDAKSHVKATGLWQFMNNTAEKFDLKIDYYVDERMDLVKSTIAASKYLNMLHERFDKWYLAAIAYNCGSGRVVEALTRATLDIYVDKYPEQKNSKKILEYRNIVKQYQDKKISFSKIKKVYDETKKWDIEVDIEDLLIFQNGIDRQYLPKESRRYIRKIISLALMNSQNFLTEEKNSHLLNIGISSSVATVPVKGGWHLRNIAKAIEMNYDELYELNKHLKIGIVPPTEKYYTINIPYDKLNNFNLNKENIEDTTYAIHTVKKGDTLLGIAKKYDLSINMIKEQNNLKSNYLSLNQKLLLPIPAEAIKDSNLLKTKNDKKLNHTIQNGDSLSSISKKYNVGISKIMKDNNLKNSILKVGDRLVIN